MKWNGSRGEGGAGVQQERARASPIMGPAVTGHNAGPTE